MSARLVRTQPWRAAKTSAASTMRGAGSGLFATPLLQRDHPPPGQATKLGEARPENGMGMSGGGPDRIERREILIEENARGHVVSHRRHAADREPGLVADEGGIGLADLFTQRSGDLPLVDPVGAAGHDQDGAA